MPEQIIRAAILNPQPTGRVHFHRDGVLVIGAEGKITFVGDWADFRASSSVTQLTGILCPPFLDAHIHIPQFPIRGKFAEGVEENPEDGRLIAGLNRNVFPAEALAADPGYATDCVRQFRADTLAQGVVGGAAYMTVHARAADIALRELGPLWSVGMVLMNQNCPDYLRTDEANVEPDLRQLAKEFGRHCIVTDRFAVAVNADLRSRATRLARDLGLRMQTHLNEQQSEKRFVEQTLYPGQTYTGVYQRDGLLAPGSIMAHCIWMGDDEWSLLRDSGSVIAHCPTSNSLLGSGVMRLDEVRRRGIPYAICTDVGASPTTSLLCEMAEFLRVHDGAATAEEALYRTTLAPAEILHADTGTFSPGRPASFIETDPAGDIIETSAEAVIRRHLLELPDGPSPHRDLRQKLAASGLQSPAEMDTLEQDVRQSVNKLEGKVRQVVLGGKQVFRREETL